MKKHTLLSTLLLLTIFIGSCQSNIKWQTVEYKGVSVQIPSDWGYKNTTHQVEDQAEDITAYSIACWSKDENKSLSIVWYDVEVESDILIESTMESQKELSSTYQVFENSKIVDTVFFE